MIAPDGLDLAPDESAFAYLPSPWLEGYRAAIQLGVSSLLLVVRELVRESGLAPAEREERLDDFVDRARELARRWLAEEAAAGGAMEPRNRIERLLKAHTMAAASAQAILDDYAEDLAEVPRASARH